jgi:hypothetical protein
MAELRNIWIFDTGTGAYRLLFFTLENSATHCGTDAKMNKFNRWCTHLFSLILVLGLTNCALPPQRGVSQYASFAEEGGKSPKRQVTQAELQDDLLRFESQFNARIQNANQSLETSRNRKTRYRASLNRLIYASNSLNIALGPSPESNLLDMITFVELSYVVLKEYWIPNFFRSEGQALDQAFSDSKQQIWTIAKKVLSEDQRKILQNVISVWRTRHAEQTNVETVRLSTFSAETGANAIGLDREVGGLFASVQQSTQAVDSARLFAERALYYAERAPFLLQLQARLGIHEIIDDAGSSLAEISSPLNHERTVKNLLKEFQTTLLITRATLDDANSTVQSIKTLTEHLSKSPQSTDSVTAILTQLSDVLKEWNHLLSSAPYQKGISQITDLAQQVNQESSHFLKRLVWVGVGLITFFWIMFVISKLVYLYFQLKIFDQRNPPNQEAPRNKAA